MIWYSKIIYNNMYKWLTVLSSIIWTCIGILLALNVDFIRYNTYFEPSRVEVSPAEAYKDIATRWSGNYLFLDVRTLSEYNQLHASWSQSTPIADLYDLWRDKLPRSEDTPIYLICTSGRLASVAYDFLQMHWFRNIKHIEWWVTWWIWEKQPVQTKQIFRN